MTLAAPTADVIRLPTAAQRHTTHLFSSVATAGFDTAAYSRMKFGSDADARVLAREMADAYAAEHWGALTTQPTLVIPAPSTSVPVAATLMGRHFHDRLNSLLDRTGNAPVQLDYIHRAVTYNDNYAQLSLEERRRLLSDDARYMNVAFAQGKTLVFVDDVRITGTHEHKLSDMLGDLGLINPVVFATYAAYTGVEPAVEHELNHVQVRDALCVAELAQERGWQVTTRGLRLLLECDTATFEQVLARLPLHRRYEVYHGAIVKAYSTHPPYAQNFAALRASLGE